MLADCVKMRPELTSISSYSKVVVDERCGTMLFARGEHEMRGGDTVLTYLIELHNGRLLGLPGEALIVLQGLAIILLSLAGISLWLWRAKRRREGAAGHAQTAVGST
jgi:uncharacterized iron-regulated membrane protein